MEDVKAKTDIMFELAREHYQEQLNKIEELEAHEREPPGTLDSELAVHSKYRVSYKQGMQMQCPHGCACINGVRMWARKMRRLCQ